MAHIMNTMNRRFGTCKKKGTIWTNPCPPGNAAFRIRRKPASFFPSTAADTFTHHSIAAFHYSTAQKKTQYIFPLRRWNPGAFWLVKFPLPPLFFHVFLIFLLYKDDSTPFWHEARANAPPAETARIAKPGSLKGARLSPPAQARMPALRAQRHL